LNTRRNENLIERLSELPKEIAADGIYKQIQANAEKLKELNQTLETLKLDDQRLAVHAVNRDELLFRIKRTIQNLEKTPIEKLRTALE